MVMTQLVTNETGHETGHGTGHGDFNRTGNARTLPDRFPVLIEHALVIDIDWLRCRYRLRAQDPFKLLQILFAEVIRNEIQITFVTTADQADCQTDSQQCQRNNVMQR